MKRQSLLGSWALLIGLGAIGAVEAQAPPAPGPRPRAEIVNAQADLGPLRRGEKAEAQFSIKNAGDALLRIVSAKPG